MITRTLSRCGACSPQHPTMPAEHQLSLHSLYATRPMAPPRSHLSFRISRTGRWSTSRRNTTECFDGTIAFLAGVFPLSTCSARPALRGTPYMDGVVEAGRGDTCAIGRPGKAMHEAGRQVVRGLCGGCVAAIGE